MCENIFVKISSNYKFPRKSVWPEYQWSISTNIMGLIVAFRCNFVMATKRQISIVTEHNVHVRTIGKGSEGLLVH